jgi:hypothetical protein
MDKKRIKLSGHQFRLKRRKEMLLKQKQSESMLGFLNSRSHTSDNTQSISISSETNDETHQVKLKKFKRMTKRIKKSKILKKLTRVKTTKIKP